MNKWPKYRQALAQCGRISSCLCRRIERYLMGCTDHGWHHEPRSPVKDAMCKRRDTPWERDTGTAQVTALFSDSAAISVRKPAILWLKSRRRVSRVALMHHEVLLLLYIELYNPSVENTLTH